MLGYQLRMKGYFGVTFYSFDVLPLSVYFLAFAYLFFDPSTISWPKNPLVLGNGLSVELLQSAKIWLFICRRRRPFWSRQEERPGPDNRPSSATGQGVPADSRCCRSARQPQRPRCCLCGGWSSASTVYQRLLYHRHTGKHPRRTAVSLHSHTQGLEKKSLVLSLQICWAYNLQIFFTWMSWLDIQVELFLHCMCSFSVANMTDIRSDTCYSSYCQPVGLKALPSGTRRQWYC